MRMTRLTIVRRINASTMKTMATNPSVRDWIDESTRIFNSSWTAFTLFFHEFSSIFVKSLSMFLAGNCTTATNPTTNPMISRSSIRMANVNLAAGVCRRLLGFCNLWRIESFPAMLTIVFYKGLGKNMISILKVRGNQRVQEELNLHIPSTFTLDDELKVRLVNALYPLAFIYMSKKIVVVVFEEEEEPNLCTEETK